MNLNAWSPIRSTSEFSKGGSHSSSGICTVASVNVFSVNIVIYIYYTKIVSIRVLYYLFEYAYFRNAPYVLDNISFTTKFLSFVQWNIEKILRQTRQKYLNKWILFLTFRKLLFPFFVLSESDKKMWGFDSTFSPQNAILTEQNIEASRNTKCIIRATVYSIGGRDRRLVGRGIGVGESRGTVKVIN